MFEYTIYNKTTNETKYLWGYSAKDAFERSPKINPNEWKVIDSEYID